MAPNRRNTFYKAYHDASKRGPQGGAPIPYSTWKRWLNTGKMTEEQLKDLGITPHMRKRRKLNSNVENETATEEQVPAPQANEEFSSGSEHSDTDRNETSDSDSESDSSDTSLSISSISTTSRSSSSSGGVSSSSEDSSSSDSEMGTQSYNPTFKIINSKFIGPDAMNDPIHPHLGISKFEVLIMILHLSMRHRMTSVFLEHLMIFVDKIVGVENSLGMSNHLFHKLFQFGRQPTAHFYCPNCKEYLGIEKTFSSGTVRCSAQECEWKASTSSLNKGNFFLTLGIKEQLHDVLSKPDLKFVPKDRLDSVVSDMMDGKIYRSLTKEGKPLINREALTLTINTDGAPVFKSGPNSLWPIYFYINEIEPAQRFAPDHIMLAGLWFGKAEANLQMFLGPVVNELMDLEKTGIVWRKPCGLLVESPVFVMCCCTDSVARPKVQNHMQFNGAFGCSICLHPNTSIQVTEKVKNTITKKKKGQKGRKNANSNNDDLVDDVESYRVVKTMRYLRGEYNKRTNKSLREHMELASVSTQPHIYGSKGMSVLCSLKEFKVKGGFALDYLHGILLGTTRKLANLWFDSTSKDEAYYIGLSIQRVDNRLKDITLPKGFRSPRPMSDRVHWKANEWRAFLLYYGLPALMNILPQEYYSHFQKMVVAIYTLCKESMLNGEVDSAHNLLQEFVWEYQDLYGEVNMVYNVHITGHIAETVAEMGPLWAYSAFPFEDANRRLLKLVMGTKGVTTQICRKYFMTKSVTKLLKNNYQAKEDILNFCCDLIGYKYLQNASKGRNGETMLGRDICFELTDVQKQACNDKNVKVSNVASAVSRAVVRGTLYHGRLTTRQKKAFDSCVRLISGEYALIDLILKCCTNGDDIIDTFFLVTKLNIATDQSPLLVPHIKQCSLDSFGDVELITSEDISRKCMFYSCSDKNYVTEIANFYELD